MALFDPQPGLVISYSYLWRSEFQRGQREGLKHRPSVVVLTVVNQELEKVVTVAPITHSLPPTPDVAIEIPLLTKKRLGLDGERSWVVVDDLNRFTWPGPDLAIAIGRNRGPHHGMLPPTLFKIITTRLVNLARSKKLAITKRDC